MVSSMILKVRVCVCGMGWISSFEFRVGLSFSFFVVDLFIYPEESRYMMNGFRLSPAVGLAFP